MTKVKPKLRAVERGVLLNALVDSYDSAKVAAAAEKWRAAVPAEQEPIQLASRLMAAFEEAYAIAEYNGYVDTFGASESKTILTNIVLAFAPDDETRWWMVREAIDLMEA